MKKLFLIMFLILSIQSFSQMRIYDAYKVAEKTSGIVLRSDIGDIRPNEYTSITFTLSANSIYALGIETKGEVSFEVNNTKFTLNSSFKEIKIETTYSTELTLYIYGKDKKAGVAYSLNFLKSK